MRYTLTWTVSKTIPTECPDYVPDPYTGEYPSYHCLVYHCKTVTENRGLSFKTKEEALSFAAKAPSSCTDFKVNGKPIKDGRPKQEFIVSDLTSSNVSGSVITDASDTNITFNP